MKIIWTFTLMMIPGVMSSMSVIGYSGGGVNITCRYNEGFTENKKYFCKGEWLDCTDQIRTDIKDKWFNNRRFSLYDDTRSAVFTVTIRNLREEDSGTYQCGVDIPVEIDSYTEVNLNVMKKQTIIAPPHLSSSSLSSSLRPPSSRPSYSPPSSSSSSYSPSSLSSSSTSSYSPSYLPSSSSSTSSYSPSSSSYSPSSSSSSSSLVICVTVILLLLIIGFMFCIVTLYKKHQTRDRDSASNISEPGTENSEAVPQPLYEEIKETRLNIDCRNTPLPKTPSDSSKTVYATAKLSTNTSDSSIAVYDTAKLPTNPSVEWHKQDNYQVPTNPSDSCNIVYATPQFPTNPVDSSKAAGVLR